ncbi:hypothetical protein [Paraflavitalea sp. CAU 1676]|uniref:hypothetical protein n=1 Tax=Paraflavitalea sp. CAU 1676 TaxID=3032598 RepID=UPI0023DCC437|nr:hypothetical protein [Paraflavitalea sp. CAU 1676]MDF2191383.1 hypothetical protein [Paraflavitalea sp. CAU 1676]
MDDNEILDFPSFQKLKSPLQYVECLKDDLWRDILQTYSDEDVQCIYIYTDWCFIVEILQEGKTKWMVPFQHMTAFCESYEGAEEALYEMYEEGPYW